MEANIPALGENVGFERGEGMRTGIIAKFTPESVNRIFGEVDIKLLDLYTDPQNLFSLALSAPKG